MIIISHYLLRDIPTLLFGHIVAVLLRGEVGDLLHGVHAVLHGLGAAGQVGGGTQDVETLNLRDVVTFGNRHLLGGGNGGLLAGPGGVSLAAGRGLYFSLGDHRFRVVDGLGRVMGLGVVLHVEFFLRIVVKRRRFVKVHNVLDGRVVLGGMVMEVVERERGAVELVVGRQRVLGEREVVVDDVRVSWGDENTAQLAG